MAEEGEDGQGNNVQEERSKILELQSEQFRMQEQLERLKNKKDALQDELQVRLTEYQGLEIEFSSEQKKEEVKIQGQAKAKRLAAEAAEGEFIKKQVRELLQKRVPVMAQNLEEDNELHSGLDGEEKTKQEEAQKTVHNTVLVNYVQLQDNARKYRTLQVTYRIDTQTRPHQLLKDACAYWGCSQNDHNLCKKEGPTDVKEVVGDLHLVDILNIKAESVLFLVAKKDKEKWEGLLVKEAEKRKQSQALQQQAERAEPDDQTNSGGWFQKISAASSFLMGQHKEEQQSEDWVDAFRQWTGIYHLLKDRSRSREDSVKWQYVPFSDWAIFSLLILLSGLIIGYQNATNYYDLKAGVQESLIAGLPGENYRIANPERFLFDTFDSSGPGPIWTEVTSGVSWVAGSLHLDGAHQHVRTRRPVPLVSRIIEVQAVLPADANCTEHEVAFGSTADMVRFSWDCDGLAISAPGNVSNSVGRDCSSGNPYSIMMRLDVEGMMHISDSSGCSNLTLHHDLQNMVRPLYMFVGATGNGIFNSISATTRVAEPVMNYKDIRRADDMWNWLGGPFIYQLFDNDSTLRRNYVPTGYMRIRQQKVKPRACPREDIPSNLAKPCHWVEVNHDTRDERPIAKGVDDFQPSQFQEKEPDPRKWQDPRLDIESPYGLIQHYYDSSGYAADYSMKAGNLGPERAQQFNEDLSFFRLYWITTSTRMIVVEVTLADHHLGGYVNVRLLLEISASGAIAPSCLLVPFHITSASSDEVANGINILRWIIVIGLLMLFRVYKEGQRKEELGKTGLHYIFSFNGMLDQVMIGLFFATEYMHLQGEPASPHGLTKFHSYSTVADRKAQLRVAEAVFLSLLLGRWVTLMRLFPIIFRFFKTFAKAATLIFYFLAMFLPVFCGNIFAANAIWQPFVFMLSSWSESTYVFFLSLVESFDVKELYDSAPSWSLPFLIWFFVSVRIFFLHMFLAIIVHCYFEVQLIEGIRADDVKWSLAQWLDWLLWPALFEKLGMGESGVSRNRGSQQGAAKDDDDDSDEDDDAEGKRD